MEYRSEQVAMNPSSYPYQGQQQVQSTVITVTQNVLPVRDHLLWSIFNFFYFNFCCLGFVALVYSVKSRDRKVVGDVEGAQQHASTARALNITIAVLVCLTVISTIVGVAFIASQRY
ncbi:dispanin subfamily A member 2b-like [Mustelus asterias]